MTTPTPAQLMQLPAEYLAQDTSRKLMDTSIAFAVVCPVFFALFVTSRMLHNTKDSWDVWILPAFSLICVLGLCVIGILIVKIGGGGRHIEYNMIHDPEAINRYLKLQTATEFLYVVAVTVPKLTILCLYLKVFSNGTGTVVRRITWVMIVVVLLQWLTVGVIVWATICQPLQFKWDKSIPGHCANLIASYRYFSVPNVITDLVILIIPIPKVRGLQVSKVKRVGILLTFFTGGMGIVAALIRFVGFFTVDLNKDPTYYVVTTMLLSIAEPGAYFICSTLPYIRPLANRVFKKTGFATNIYGTDHSSKRTYTVPEGTKTGVSTAEVSSGPSTLGSSRTGFIELVDTVEVKSSRASSV